MERRARDRPKELTLDWHRGQNEALSKLLAGSAGFGLPAGLLDAAASFDRLYDLVRAARGNLAGTLNTGLSQADTRELLETRNIATAVRLVRQGLVNQNKLPPLAA